MYMVRKFYYMDLLGMSGNINIQSRNNRTSKSGLRREPVMLIDWSHNSSGTSGTIIYNPLREAKVIFISLVHLI